MSFDPVCDYGREQHAACGRKPTERRSANEVP
jgi:hypothetical protein